MKICFLSSEARISITVSHLFGMHDVIIPTPGYFILSSEEGSICNVQNVKGSCFPKSISIMFDLFMLGNVPGVVSCWTRRFCRTGLEEMIFLLVKTQDGFVEQRFPRM